MTVTELRVLLETMPPEAEVTSIWDGAARSQFDVVYVSRRGDVVLAQRGDTVYYTQDRPKTAPTESENGHWVVP